MRFLLAKTLGFTPEMHDKLGELGFDIVLLDGTEEQYYDQDFSDIDAVMCYRFFNYNDITRFPKLKYIHTTSAGLDHMPMDYIKEHNIHLCNARGVYSVPMAEFALGGVLHIYKYGPRMRRQQTEHVWKQRGRMREFGGKKVCIIGSGSIGTETAKRFSAMGCYVVGMCRHPAPTPYFDEVVHVNTLDEVLPDTDIVILTVPLTDETYHLFDEKRFEKMKDGSVLVNISRGAIVDTAALQNALESKKLFGAVIDVFEQEPLPADSPLWDLENIVLTPHFSYSGENNVDRLFKLTYDDTVKWLATLEPAVE